ncbi:LysR family transcriptional regulator, partial [Nitrospirillum viridazoti]
MNLRDLRYLLAVAQHRHFGRAAAACNVSQPTLSSQVAKLEARLGAPLFERTNKWVAPTPLGEEVLVHAARAVAEADA